MSPQAESSGSRPVVKGLTGTAASREIEREFNGLSEYGKAVTNSVSAACTAKIEKEVVLSLPLVFYVFPKKKEGSDEVITKSPVRLEYEANCVNAFEEVRVQDHIKKSLLEKLKNLKATSVTFDVIDGKRIWVKIE